MLSPLAGGICALGAAGLAVGGYAYAAQWPGSRVFGRALIAPRRPGELALTFDDGPNPAWTPKLLDVLARHGVHATFFMLGSRAQAQPALVRRMASEGHLLGNHSWDHPNLAYTGTAKVVEELRKTKDAIEQAAGVEVRYFRPPFGARRPAVFRIARRLGMTTVLWNAMTSDWSEQSVDKIVDALSAKIDGHQRRGWATTIVLHDGGHLDPAADRGPSVAAAGRLLDRYAQTHRFVTMDAWGKTTT
jgi:peptidoglycan/xylan/chitin deacetylase (PgdA/CDA1 family)